MVRSLYSAVAGLTVHQTRMDVIGNNIANVNTYGFKASRTSFSDIYYQSKKASTGGTAVFAGNNEAAVGYGVEISSIDKDMSASSFQTTNRVLDVAISGDGMFMVGTLDDNKKIDSVNYTRYGNFGVDSDGNLVNTLNQFVLGTKNTSTKDGGGYSSKEMAAINPADSPTELDTMNVNELVWDAFRKYTKVEYKDVSSTLKPTTVSYYANNDGTGNTTSKRTFIAEKTDPDDPTKKILVATRASGGTDSDVSSVSGGPTSMATPIYDKDGNEIYLGYSTYADANANPAITADGEASDEILYSVNGRFVNENGVEYDPYTGYYLDEDGNHYTLSKTREYKGDPNITDPKLRDPADYTDWVYKYTAVDGPKKGIEFTYDSISKVYQGQKNGKTIYTDMKLGPLKYSDLDGFAVGSDGVLTATYAGQIKALARLELATFDNIEGLEQVGETEFGESSASGKPNVKSPGKNGTGTVKSSKLEMSNVNLASEFSDMIVTQRGFQANARIVTTSDSMLEELVNLKR